MRTATKMNKNFKHSVLQFEKKKNCQLSPLKLSIFQIFITYRLICTIPFIIVLRLAIVNCLFDKIDDRCNDKNYGDKMYLMRCNWIIRMLSHRCVLIPIAKNYDCNEVGVYAYDWWCHHINTHKNEAVY